MKYLKIAVVLALAVYLGLLLKKDPGQVLIHVNHWTLETTLWIFVICLIALFFGISLIFAILQRLFKIPQTLRYFARQRAICQTQQGLIELQTGAFSDAQYRLVKAAEKTSTPLINYVLAAVAANRAQDYLARDSHLARALTVTPKAKLALALTKADLAIEAEQWLEAKSCLEALLPKYPKHAYLLTLLAKLYSTLNDWPALNQLLPRLQKYKRMSEPAFKALNYRVKYALLSHYLQQNDTDNFQAVSKQLPKSMKTNPEIIALHVRFLLSIHEHAAAEKLLHQTLKQAYQEHLIALLANLAPSEQNLKFAENLLAAHNTSPALLLALARICCSLKLWGKAKEYYAACIQTKPAGLVYQEFGELLERQFQDKIGAGKIYQQGLCALTKAATA